MNTKTIAIVGGVILLLAGGFFFMQGKSGSPLSTSTGFSSIQDALSKSISLECNFADEDGRETTSYIKNGAVRADFVSDDPTQSGSMIFADNTSYVWTGDGNAFMMHIPDEVESDENLLEKGTDAAASYRETLGEMEKYKDSCKPAVVSDSLFVPPSDIEFVDFSEMMEGMMDGGLENMPAGMDGGSGMTEEQLEEMMDQFGAQQ